MSDNKPTGCAQTITIIGLIGSLVTIFGFVTGIFSIPQLSGRSSVLSTVPSAVIYSTPANSPLPLTSVPSVIETTVQQVTSTQSSRQFVLLRTLRAHADWVLSVAVSPDGKTFASGSFDHTI